MSEKEKLPSGVLRRLAVESSTDPRTVASVYAGDPVHGMSRRRARQALIQAGYLEDTPLAEDEPIAEGSSE